MEKGCQHFPEISFLSQDDKKQVCHHIREDGVFIQAGENDNLIIQKLILDPPAIGIFGYSFLDQNRDRIQAILMNDIEPTFETIESGDYPIARPLFFYVKTAHFSIIPGIKDFVAEFLSPHTVGEFGSLVDKGLIPLQSP